MLRDEVVAAAASVAEEEVLEAADIEEDADASAEVEVEVVFEFLSSRPRASLSIRVPRLNASGSCFCTRPNSKGSLTVSFRLLLPLYSESEASRGKERDSHKVGDRAAGG